MENLQPTFLAILFPIAWLAILWVIAVAGGWASLASQYPAPEGFQWRHIRDCVDGSFLWVRWVDLVLRDGFVVRLYGGLANDAWEEWRNRVHKESGSAA